MVLIRLRVHQEAERTQLRIREVDAIHHKGGKPLAPRKSRIGFHSHRECAEEAHEYANELGKQCGKNPRKIPKFSKNHERTIENNI